jgi:hypothetical protein
MTLGDDGGVTLLRFGAGVVEGGSLSGMVCCVVSSFLADNKPQIAQADKYTKIQQSLVHSTDRLKRCVMSGVLLSTDML